MKHSLPPLDRLKVFEAAARLMSFSAAADELCLSRGAVSYQIRKLEEYIQCALFKRGTCQVYLSDAGQTLLKSTQAQFAQLSKTLAELNSNQRNRPVSLATTTYVAARWLSSRIARFNQHYPDITIQIQHSLNSAGFSLKDVDIEIRWCPCEGRPRPERLLELPMPLYPVASPALLAKAGLSTLKRFPRTALASPAFARIPLLCEDRAEDLWQAWFAHSDLDLNNPRRIISDANVRVQAAIDGQGLILADELMRNELDTGLLEVPFEAQLHGFGYALLSSPARMVNENAVALREWLLKNE